MAGVTTYSCTKCRPIDTEIIQAYEILSNTSKLVSEQEADRVTAEQGRVAAENERERVFGLDHGTATDDHATAVSDHGIAGDDHLLAVADHGTAGDDHTLAEGDHTRAGEDHLASTSATSRANNAAAAAEHMVDLHQGPPGEDGKSPYIGLNGNWYVWDDTTQQYVDSGERAQGRDGNPGSSQAYPFELVNNEETNDSTKAHTAAGAKRLKDELTQLDLKLNNLANTRYYGIFASADLLPDDAAEKGYAYVGASTPLAIYEVDYDEETEQWVWTDTEVTVNSIQGEPGTDGVGFGSVASSQDGTVVITLSSGDTITIDFNHLHPQYGIIEAGGSQPSGGFLPDIVYKLGTITGSVTFALASAVTGNINHYFWTFDTGDSAPTVTWPSYITWVGGSAPLISANKHYEVSILDGIAAILEV